MSYASDVTQALRTGVIALVDHPVDPDAVAPGHVAQEILFSLFEDEAVIREIYTWLQEDQLFSELGYLEIGAVLDALKWVLKGGEDDAGPNQNSAA